MNHICTKTIIGKNKSALKAALLLCFLAFTLPLSVQAQYCLPEYGDGCDFGDDIEDFTLTGVAPSAINDLGTGCGTTDVGYDDRTGIVAPVDLMQGNSYSGTITTNAFNLSYRIWIDFNDDFVFDASEDLTGVISFNFSSNSSFTIDIPLMAPVGQHTMRVRGISWATMIDPCDFDWGGETHDYLVNIVPAPPCTGAPSIVGVIPPGPIASCAGASQTLTLDIAVASGYDIQWQSSTNGGISWTDVPGATDIDFTFTVTGNADYRAYVTCSNSSLADTSDPVNITATPPVFAAVPFFEDFETWQDYCDNNDVPAATTGTNWTNQPATGDASWRRNDEGFTANWNSTWGAYFPTSISGLHSARFSSVSVANSMGTGSGNLDLYLDCSAPFGNKQLYFYHINESPWGPPQDELNIYLSTDGGATFNLLSTFDSASNWTRRSVPIASNSSQTIVRFEGVSMSDWNTDQGIDSIYVAPPCTGTPVAGTIDPAGPTNSCPGKSFVLNNIGSTMGGNIDYAWQQSTDLGVTWTAVVGGNGIGTQTYTTPSLYDTIYYRLVVTCLTSNVTDTTNVVMYNIAPPTYAPVPYAEDFENWVSFCDVNDAPSLFWINNPSTGDSSWRRDDDGLSAGWTSFGDFFPTFYSGIHSARFPSSVLSNSSGVGEGTMDLLLDCSATLGDKQLYFYHLNQWDFSNADNLTILLSTDGGINFTQLGSWDTAASWTKRSLPIASNSAQTVVRFRTEVQSWAWPGSDIGIDSVYVAPPCTGTPVAGSIAPGGTITSCAGNDFTFTNVGGTMAGNLQYDWQESLDGGATWATVTTGNGNGTFQYTTDPLLATVSYRLVVTCLGSGISDTTPVVTVDIVPPVYATLPYLEGFENWISYCDNLDVPSPSWLNKPSTGDLSWCRYDQGTSANWNSPGFGGYSPISIEGNYSARIHSSNGWSSSTDNTFDLFVDCSAPGTKELQFHYINPAPFAIDELGVEVSEDAGVTFTNLTTLFGGIDQWELQTIPITSNSATTIIRFTANSDWNDDMGMDNLKVLLPCDGTPVAGTVDSLTPCSGEDFNLSLTGYTQAGGLTYQWQESADGINWTDIPGATQAISTHNITAPTYVRAIITCSSNGQSDTSDIRQLQLAGFLYCYCESAAQFGDDNDIGNVTIDKVPSGANILNNGVAAPLLGNPSAINSYTDFAVLPPTNLYKDSAYSISITHIASSTFFNGGNVSAWIDFNQDGTFDPFGEMILTGSTTNTPQQATATFTVPGNAPIGQTGMRVVLTDAFSFPSPCNSYNSGETEDYIVNIDYQPCNGPSDAGTARITDTLLCPGFPFTLTDTSYEKERGGLVYTWQSSTDGINWTDIPGAFGEDTISLVSDTINTYYRFKLICTNSNSESYSNVKTVYIKPYFQCYCQSYANGGPADESDAGVFTIGNYVFNTGGGHLNNATAVEAYTDYTNGAHPIWLSVDSVYNVSMLHTIKSGTHQDAKITLFIDFNNNKQYDIPAERVWTGFSTSAEPYLNTTIQVPADAVRNNISGMRLIVNSDINPNVPSDEACGLYTSGETTDFTVEFKNPWELSVGNVNGGGADMQLYPNPTNGRFTVSANLPGFTESLELSVTDVNGRVIAVYNYKPNGKTFQTDLNMNGAATGMYFVTLKTGTEKIVRKLIVQ